MAAMSDNGFDDIISKRSNVVVNLNIDLDSLSVEELIDFIIANPTCLKRPIIIDERKMQVGYNAEDIDAFLPLKLKELAIMQCTPDCPSFEDCDRHGK